MLRLAGIVRESIVDGPGVRFVVFAQGCPHRCPGCQNPQTWSFGGGFEVKTETIIAEMKRNPLLKGLTLSGGEPFCHPSGMAELAREARLHGFDVVAYTGFTFEELLEQQKKDTSIRTLLEQIDLLIDGPFIGHLKSYELIFRGSSNQRIINVKSSLLYGYAVDADIIHSVRIAPVFICPELSAHNIQ
jgi:anaerobic ribonucleoside-triphosphate reductase activating protein